MADNTLILFCSDNGPEGKAPGGRRQGVTNGLRGRKRALYDGGVRVPALACWPGRLQAGAVVDTPLSTLDYFPTIRKLTGYQMPDRRPVDGQDIWPILAGKTEQREKAIPFVRGNQATLVKDRYKLVLPQGELYELSEDWGEENNVASEHPERAGLMKKELMATLESFEASHAGEDYGDPAFKPVGKWKPVKK